MRNSNDDRELWVVQYGSDAYNKVNFWTQFFLSKAVDHKKLRAGQNLLVDTQEHTPHRWTMVFSEDDDNWTETVQHLRKTIDGLNCNRISFFSNSEGHIDEIKKIFKNEIMKKSFFVKREIES